MFPTDKTIDRIANILGNVGKFLVFVGMGCGCYLFWHLIIKHIILK